MADGVGVRVRKSASPKGLLSDKGIEHSRYSVASADIPELTEGADYEVYRKMRRGDATVSAAMRSIELPIQRATFDIQPPSEPCLLYTSPSPRD